MKSLFLSALAFLALSPAHAAPNPALKHMQDGVSRPAPEALTLDAYRTWLHSFRNGEEVESAFLPKIFAWYEREKARGLPREVSRDPQKIYADVEGPLAETIEMEDSGEITEGNTVGAEVYAEQTGTTKQALEAMLFRWGKPTGAEEGGTHPPGGSFNRRADYLAPNADWGPGAFASLTIRRDGGIVKDINDRYIVLVRGDEEQGFDLVMQFMKIGGDESQTEKCFAMAMIRPLGNGKVSFKISTRYQGQSYKILGGVKLGRKKVGFNEEKVRELQAESNGLLKELRDSGKIRDRQ